MKPLRLAIPLLLACLLLAAASCGRRDKAPGELYRCDSFTITRDSVVESDGAVARAASSMHLTSNYLIPRGAPLRDWKISDITLDYPRATLGMKLPDALYNMAVAAVSCDTTAAISPYAVMLSLAYLDPGRALRSLRAQVKNGRIIPSTVGSWPIDVSRVSWILAAWEIYLVTGDDDWARELYEVALLSLRDDNFVNYNSSAELFCGGIVPLENAAEYYPTWMQPVDVFRSMSLTANVLYSRAYSILGAIGEQLGDNVTRYREIAAALARTVNQRFWLPDRGYYSQYLYGTFPVQSPVADNMGQALCVYYGLATPEMTARLYQKTGVSDYGVPAVWPSTSDHTGLFNNCVRSDTEAFWTLAAARAHNIDALRAGIASQMRAAALYASERYYVDAFTGRAVTDSLTASHIINAAAARLATTFRIFAGMEFTTAGIEFHPVVPAEYNEEKFISGFRYRDADLSIVIHGTGSRIARFTIDGVAMAEPIVPADISGRHNIEITLAGNSREPMENLHISEPFPIPATPVTRAGNGCILIASESKAAGSYNVYTDGVLDLVTDLTRVPLARPDLFSATAIAAVVDKRTGYTSRPLFNIPADRLIKVEADSFAIAGTALIEDVEVAERFVELSATLNTHLAFELEVTAPGRYIIDISYANGSGNPLYQRNCGMRTLLVNGDRAGVIVMPQLTDGDWTVTGYSNMLEANLERGINTLALDYVVPYNINSAGGDNVVLVDFLRLIRLQ